MLKKNAVPTLLVATALAADMSAMPALPQDAPGDALVDTSELEELVVTGTRAARDRYQAPSPTTVISAAVIDNQAATGLGEILEQSEMAKTPAFRTRMRPTRRWIAIRS